MEDVNTRQEQTNTGIQSDSPVTHTRVAFIFLLAQLRLNEPGIIFLEYTVTCNLQNQKPKNPLSLGIFISDNSFWGEVFNLKRSEALKR